jgi:hypothetical protein
MPITPEKLRLLFQKPFELSEWFDLLRQLFLRNRNTQNTGKT